MKFEKNDIVILIKCSKKYIISFLFPFSPYFDGDWTMPTIPVIGINYDQAKDILQNFTNAKGIAKTFYYGLPLNTSAERNFTAKVEVYRNENVVTLNNVVGTIRGRYVIFMIKHNYFALCTIFSSIEWNLNEN